MKRIFSMESTCSSGGSSMSVPSRSTNSTRSGSCQAPDQAIVLFGRADRDAQRLRRARCACRGSAVSRARAAPSTASASAKSTSRKFATLGHIFRTALQCRKRGAQPFAFGAHLRDAFALDGELRLGERGEHRLDGELRNGIGRDDLGRAAPRFQARAISEPHARRRGRRPSTACAARRGSESARARSSAIASPENSM